MSSERIKSERLKHQVELRIREDRGVEKMSRTGRINKMIVFCTIDVVDDLGRGVFKDQVWQCIM